MLSKAFGELEAAAGVKKVRGRAWHGLRRGMKEAIEGITADEGVRDTAQGWTVGGGTRHSYADEEHARRIAEAAKVRAQVWHQLTGATLGSLLDEEAAAVREMQRRLASRGEPLLCDVLLAARRLHDALTTAADAANTEPPAEEEEFGALSASDAEHHRIADELALEVERRGLTGRQAAAIMGVSTSYTTWLRQRKTLNVISTAKLRDMAARLAATAPEGSDPAQ